MSRGRQGPASRGGSRRSRPATRTATGREADRIKNTRAGWASPATAVATYWRSGPLPVPVAGFAAGLWAALTGVTIAVVATLVVWIFAAGESASNTAMRVGADIWLAAHGAPFRVGDGVWTLLPWAWVLLPSLGIWAAGRWVAHRAAVAYPKSVIVASVCLSAGYALVALLAALFGTLSGAGAMPVRAAFHAGAVALLVSAAAMMHRAGLGASAVARARHMLRPAAGALAVLVGGSALLLTTALVSSHSSGAELFGEIRPGLVGVLALFALWLGYLPSALMWALAYGVGAGIQVGGATVGPASALDEAVPMLGLHMVPTTAHYWWFVGCLVPVAAGAVLSALAPAGSRREWLTSRAICLASVLIVVDLWWTISVGRIGTGRLDLLGPSPLAIPAIFALLVVGVLLQALWVWGSGRWRSRHVIDLTETPEDVADTTA